MPLARTDSTVAVVASFMLAVTATESQAQTFLTVPQPFATIQSAIDGAQNGDTVLVGPGTYFDSIDLGMRAIPVACSRAVHFSPPVTPTETGAMTS